MRAPEVVPVVSTNRKALVRAYMHEHGVKYTEALRALGFSSLPGQRVTPALQYMLSSWNEHDSLRPMSEGPLHATAAEAKAAGGEEGDVVTSGFFAPDRHGEPDRWHNYPYGNWAQCSSGVWAHPLHWDETPQPGNGWSPTWFERFPTPSSAAAAPGIANGDVTYKEIEGHRFVTESGTLVTRLLPYLSSEATFTRFTDVGDLVAGEMKRITSGLDPRLGIRLEEAQTLYGRVQYWEFETPDLAGFMSWSSVDRHEEARRDALSEWTMYTHPRESTINLLPFPPLEACEFCRDEPVTRRHPLAPGRMIGSSPADFESVVDIEMPFPRAHALETWENLLLTHVVGGTQAVSHDGCTEYWEE